MRVHLENNFAELWITKGILYVIYKPLTILSYPVAREVLRNRLELQDDKSFPIYCDIRGIRDSDKVARDYLAREGNALTKAIAYRVQPPITEAMINFYFQRSRPSIPTKLFTEKEPAIEFLRTFV